MERDPKEKLVKGVNRCPFCHEDVEPGAKEAVACAWCLARHHEACWSEGHGSCASCGREAKLEPAREEKPKLTLAELRRLALADGYTEAQWQELESKVSLRKPLKFHKPALTAGLVCLLFILIASFMDWFHFTDRGMNFTGNGWDGHVTNFGVKIYNWMAAIAALGCAFTTALRGAMVKVPKPLIGALGALALYHVATTLYVFTTFSNGGIDPGLGLVGVFTVIAMVFGLRDRRPDD